MKRVCSGLIFCILAATWSKPLFAQAVRPDACQMIIRIDANGRISENRMQGMFHVSRKTLASDLSGGCEEAGPVSSVIVYADRATKHATIQQVLDLVHIKAPTGIPVTLHTDHAGNE